MLAVISTGEDGPYRLEALHESTTLTWSTAFGSIVRLSITNSLPFEG